MEEKEYGVIVKGTVSGGTAHRKAVVLTADKFEDMEVYVPVFRLIDAGWDVKYPFFRNGILKDFSAAGQTLPAAF